MNFYGHLIVKKLKDYALNFSHGSYRTTLTETKKLSNDSCEWLNTEMNDHAERDDARRG